MKLKIYQVDAFSNKVFSGNPAAVCLLGYWITDEILQQIASENNLAETAFLVETASGYHIRWFTPKAEVDLCGHATLATAFILFRFSAKDEHMISFQSRSGILTVTKDIDWLTLNFPADKISKTELSQELLCCFNRTPVEVYRGLTDYMFVFSSENEILNIIPDFANIKNIEARGIIITAKGDDTDFISRFFAPAVGIDEDPVTGSAHTTLAPYWSKQLSKMELTARQVSERGGFLMCRVVGERVEISGQSVLYLEGEIFI